MTTLTPACGTAAGELPSPGMRPPALAAVTQQARLQQRGRRRRARRRYELLPPEDGRGFALLPEPSPGDVMFDFEGDPFWTPAQGLMFLVGLLVREGDGWRYEAIWAHDRAGEKRGVRAPRRSAHAPGSPSTPTCTSTTTARPRRPTVKQLMAQHATREAEVDDLLRRAGLRRPADGHAAGAARRRAQLLAQADRAARRLRARRRRWARAPTPCSATSAGATSGEQAELDAHRGLQRGGLPGDAGAARLAARRPPGRHHRAGARSPSAAIPTRRASRPTGERELRPRRSSPPARSRDRRAGWPASCSSITRREARPAWWRYYALQRDGRERAARRPRGARRARAGRRAARRTASMLRVRPALPEPGPQDRAGRLVRPIRRRQEGVHVERASTTARGTLVVRRSEDRARGSRCRARCARRSRINTRVQRAALLRLAVAVRDGDAALPRAPRRARQRAAPLLRASSPARDLRRSSSPRQRGARTRARREHARRPGAARHGQDVARRAADRRSHRARQARRRHGDEPQGDQQPAGRGRARRRRATACASAARAMRVARWTPPEHAQVEIVSGSGATASASTRRYALVAGTTRGCSRPSAPTASSTTS